MNVSAEASRTAPFRAHLAKAGWFGALAAVGLASVALLVLAVDPLAALVPVMGVAAAFAVIQLPLRWTVNAMLFAMLAFDETLESYGQFRTPFALVADLLHYNINSTFPVPGAAVTGMEAMIVGLLALRAHRMTRGSRLDEGARVENPKILRDLIVLYLAGVLFAELIGLAKGWGAVPWKLRNLAHPILLAGLFLAAYRNPKDALPIGRIVVFAACVKGILAHVVQRIARAEHGGMWNSALSHGDSMIFSVAACLIVLRYLESPDRRLVLPSLGMLGLIFLGSAENDRRIVWVMMAMGGLMAYAIRPFRGWQRVVTRVLLIVVPAVSLYVAIGWNRGGRLFGPVQTLRGVVDTSHDTSAYWREVETWNIAVTMSSQPLFGMGLGGEYREVMLNDDISSIYKEYREWPHNTVLGLLMLMGLFGFTAHWVLLPAALFLSVRSYWFADDARDRLVALGCVVAIVASLVLAWGDTGAHYPQFKIFAALAIAFAAKVAVSTGAWPSSRPA